MNKSIIPVGFALILLASSLALNHPSISSSISEAHAVIGPGPYDGQPNHIWNRVYRQFFVRIATDGKEYGAEEIDPLLWRETKYLISGPSHESATKVLDEFLSTHAENLITDPLKRALFQRDMWAIFDWLNDNDSNQRAREELQIRLAEIIRRVALSAAQINALPDNYVQAVKSGEFPNRYDTNNREQPFLPADLFKVDGPWVMIGNDLGRSAARAHTSSPAFLGRSVFLVFIRLPGGRAATLEYLEKLGSFPQKFIFANSRPDSELLQPNPDLPQFPVGTQFALVRRMILINNFGQLTPTQLTEMIQLRVYHSIPTGTQRNQEQSSVTQDDAEFRLNRTSLFDKKAGGLQPVLADEKHFSVFMAHGIDWFELAQKEGKPSVGGLAGATLKSCSACHAAPGVHSFLSFSDRRFDYLRASRLQETTVASEEWNVINWKRERQEWGFLRGLWLRRN